MSYVARRFAVAALFVAGSTLCAQQPMPGPGGPPPGGMAGGPMAGATFLLAHTGDLQLTDQQVVKLAAIARRESGRRRAMMSAVDSMRRTFTPRRDSAGPPRRDPQMEARLTQVREQARTDLRDAITVLTPDQQAQAWMMMSQRGGRDRGQGMRMRMREMGRMRARGPADGPQDDGPRPNDMRGRRGGAGPMPARTPRPRPGRRPVE
jgi:hypothetical protein